MTDTRLEEIVGRLLQTGVVLAASVVLVGGIWYLLDNGPAPVSYARFHPAARSLHALLSLPRPQAVILAGLLLLIATPVARVVFSIFAFALERDRLYVLLTAIVLGVLLYSIATAWW